MNSMIPSDPDRRPSRRLTLLRPRVAFPFLILFPGLLSPVLHRGYWLSSLPSVPEPFDVEAFKNRRTPDDQNALVEYRKVLASPLLFDESWYDVYDELEHAAYHRLLSGDAPRLTPRQLDLLDQSSELLEIWRAGTEKSAVGYVAPFAEDSFPIDAVMSIQMLATARIKLNTDAPRDEDALKWFRALVRFSYHIASSGGTFERSNNGSDRNPNYEPRWKR